MPVMEGTMSNHLDYEINKELGECYLFMGDFDKAEEYYAKAVSSNGIHADPYLGLATIAVQRGELDKAMTLYSKAASIEQNDKTLAGLALVEMEMGRHEAAFGHFDKALDSNPENVIAVYGMMQTGHALGRLPEVLPRMERCLEENPKQNEVRFSLAGCLVSLGRQDDAMRELGVILEQDPGHQAARELFEQLAA